MHEILEFLKQYGLTLETCHEDWAEQVKNLGAIEQSLSAEERKIKVDKLLATFPDYHTIEDVIEPKPVKLSDEGIVIDYSKDRATKKFQNRRNRKNNFGFNID